MASPMSTSRNDYTKDRKNSTVFTPDDLANQIFQVLPEKYKGGKIVDVACGTGKLSEPFSPDVVYGYDINEDFRDSFQSVSKRKFINKDFLSLSKPQKLRLHSCYVILHLIENFQVKKKARVYCLMSF